MPVTKPSANPDKSIDLAVLEQAAGWFATLGDENATDEDRRNWQSWHDENAAHQAAWQRVEAIGSRFAAVPPEGSNVTRNLLDKGTSGTTNRRNGIKAIALLCTVGLGGWVAQRTQPWHHMLASHSTSTGEQRQYILDDKSTLWLNTATNVNVEYSPTLRRIRVREGEILVQTHADSIMPARPFVVETRHGRMQALGTRFLVRDDGKFTNLAVYEGIVQVQPAEPGSASRTIQTGEHVRFNADGIQSIAPGNDALQSWHKGVLLAEYVRLGDFIAELARYRHGQLVCHPAVADLRIVGTYRLDDTDAVLALLQATLPVRIRHTLPWRVDVLPR